MIDGTVFAREWEAAWNSHDLDRILAHYAPGVRFRSRKALPIVGVGDIEGLDQLRTYWSKALIQQPNLRFTVQQVFEGHQMLVLVYRNHNGVEAAETLRFDQELKVIEASACHGI